MKNKEKKIIKNGREYIVINNINGQQLIETTNSVLSNADGKPVAA